MQEYKRSRIAANNQPQKATITAAPEEVGYEFVNSFDLKNRNKTYRPGSNDFSIEIDMGMTTNISWFSINGKSDSPLGISDQAIITVRASMINLFDGNEPLIKTAKVEEIGAYLDLTTETEQQGVNYRYWKIDINDEFNSSDIEIAYMYLGDHLNFAYNLNIGFGFEQRDRSRVQSSDTGKLFTSRKPQQRTFTGLGVNYIPTDDRKAFMKSIQNLGIINPFLLILDPTECTFESDFSVTPVYFSRNVPRFSHVALDMFDVSFQCAEVL